ncbi:uncharacterized protein AB675_3521 [Cyphellophora attinorum]|uniref:Uncharacterized protein n=1 Tax=Cyphellophora attinorum TaxID=1664694 RepID=A0A0N1HAE9_9EURO|nr:uncharacterized protein AB675_3521 [Phialophora attinorum]KPI39575.1 hypothetical protein AB675_3521 [Phialophora attinorum]
MSCAAEFRNGSSGSATKSSPESLKALVVEIRDHPSTEYFSVTPSAGVAPNGKRFLKTTLNITMKQDDPNEEGQEALLKLSVRLNDRLQKLSPEEHAWIMEVFEQSVESLAAGTMVEDSFQKGTENVDGSLPDSNS